MMRHYIAFGIALILLSMQLSSLQAVSCDDVWIDAEDIVMERNDTEYFYFPVYNDSREAFDVSSVEVWRETGKFEISVVDYPDEIEAKNQGELTIRVKTPPLDEESFGTAYVKVRGWFEEGKYCGLAGIDKGYFDVDVIFEEQTSECNEILIKVNNVYVDEDSTQIVSFSIENDSAEEFELYDIDIDESSTYFDAFIYSKPRFIESWDSEAFRVKIESNRVSSDKRGTVTVQAKGRFDDGTYCSYGSIREEDFKVFVENDSPWDEPKQEENCEEIYLNAGSIRVEKGRTGYATIFLENSSAEDFLIDYVSVFDSSPNFKAEENGYGKVVPAFGASYINVKVRAYDYGEPGEEEAFVEAKGHFQNEKNCRLFGGRIAAFPVIVEEKEVLPYSSGTDFSGSCTFFSLIVPEAKTIGKAGTVDITIDNRTMERATVRLSGPGLTVQPLLISVPRHSLVSEKVSVSSVLQETSLVYSVEGLGCNTTKSTKIVSTDVAQEEGEEDMEQEEADRAMQAISTGFMVLGQAGAVLGLVVLAVLAVYLVVKP